MIIERDNILVVGIIPARIVSKRFPKKILADIEGKPMIAHVAERALEAEMLDKVIIAIDSEETKSALSSYKFDMVMTDVRHSSGTDRVSQVAKTIDEAKIIINIKFPTNAKSTMCKTNSIRFLISISNINGTI